MESNDLILSELVSERERILNEINILKRELEIIQKVIDKRAQNEFDGFKPIKTKEKKPKKPLFALLDLFNEDRTHLYSPSQLRDELEYLRKQGLLISNAKNLLFIVHSIIRNLERKKVIIKQESNGVTYYGLRH